MTMTTPSAEQEWKPVTLYFDGTTFYRDNASGRWHYLNGDRWMVSRLEGVAFDEILRLRALTADVREESAEPTSTQPAVTDDQIAQAWEEYDNAQKASREMIAGGYDAAWIESTIRRVGFARARLTQLLSHRPASGGTAEGTE
jgi:hypothetical protein